MNDKPEHDYTANPEDFPYVLLKDKEVIAMFRNKEACQWAETTLNFYELLTVERPNLSFLDTLGDFISAMKTDARKTPKLIKCHGKDELLEAIDED